MAMFPREFGMVRGYGARRARDVYVVLPASIEVRYPDPPELLNCGTLSVGAGGRPLGATDL